MSRTPPIRVEETGHNTVPCPCGCGRDAEQHDGRLRFENGGGYFRLMLMIDSAGEPIAWISLCIRGSAEDPRDRLVTMFSNAAGVRFEDADASPVATIAEFDGWRMTRDEILERPDVARFCTDCADALFGKHSRLIVHLLG